MAGVCRERPGDAILIITKRGNDIEGGDSGVPALVKYRRGL
jgi:hypothetical protein